MSIDDVAVAAIWEFIGSIDGEHYVMRSGWKLENVYS